MGTKNKQNAEKYMTFLVKRPTSIGGRGVGNWEEDQPKFGWGGSGFWTPRGGNKFRLSEGGKEGGNKRKNRKIFLIATEKRQNFGNFEQK